ncbi:MAG: DNA mismatch repair protein MutS, partial [Hymenobacteraceae bacterium]|nr:DNA mismatch repair protein MutS [Hymenobacteraceae bacterium]MDX5398095.1 DNA mismatch repair protein MutS [Hymenobacteraceae bacterium]MDX5514167.1 DNA mismatch repair protein MutS [Hymenobacteraceae bacterium]
NNLLMWDFYWMWRLERWKKQSVPNLEPAIAALAEVETLSSFSAFWYANPSNILPNLSDTPFEVTAESLGHPLIIKDDRVVNDFEMAGAGKTVVITGSNMSGKSTFLRTVGLNVVLALAGAPVAARKFTVYPMQVFTSMRTADDLSESTSSFYAELKRLRLLLDLTETGQPVLYLLDEILKGTNSHDRHLGAVSLVRQLQRQNQSGLISTHDLALGELAQQSPETIRNYSFNSHIEANKIIFDYHLTPGICRSFNASQLMKQMGIEILEG